MKKPKTRKQWRCFDRAIAGLYKYRLLNRRVYWLTLTTNPASVVGLNDDERLELIQRNFRAFQERCRELTSPPFALRGLVPNRVKWEFFSIRTGEGYGVIHCFFVGIRLSDRWIKEQWNELHGSHIIKIKETFGNVDKSALYVAGQYISGQEGECRYGWTRGWCYQGFVQDIEKLRFMCRDCSFPKYYKGYEYYPLDSRLFRKCLFEKVRENVLTVCRLDGFNDFMRKVKEYSVDPLPFF